MVNVLSKVLVNKDMPGDLLKSLDDLARKTVCIGIPQEKDSHRRDGITDAELLYIHTNGVRDKTMIREMQHDLDSGTPYSVAHELYVHENGSPLWQSPPRPVLEPALDSVKDEIALIMKEAVNVALEGGNIDVELQKVGQLGENTARGWFNNPENKWPANSEETIKRKGSDRPLIDTGQLKRSIKYVIKESDT